MISRADVTDLITATPDPGVSILLPMHVTGTETTQNPIRFTNALRDAESELAQSGVEGDTIAELLAAARELLDDHDFWQHQSAGLAVFASEQGALVHRIPYTLEERVVVGQRFHTAPLLPLLGENESALVLTATASGAHLYRATRDSLTELDADLPGGVSEDAAENDYEAPAQASPPARPNTGSANISRAQVYGDGPPEWRETRLDDFVQKIASELERVTAAEKPPVVLLAGADIIGRLRSTGLLTADVEVNPDVLDEDALHARAWEALRPAAEQSLLELLDRYRSLAGSGDDRAASRPGAVRAAASDGRVETLIVPRSSLDEPDEGLAELVADTVSTSGSIHLVDEEAGIEHPVAILRY
ncbi:hypothetical protein [Chryseoglobus sp. 28M-23]|uniref:baeRF3 domain-containing protein n=1 Tax=Chryseoglobus sp. 28M-23 TaxID=2772253 RepID=UPI0017469213|nr:hypothetical protein [Chryseoglobus sp. 28M-23]QOD93035.1 hypothetical protein IE160_08775 [Chryseoglobus sp. 28M-23]